MQESPNILASNPWTEAQGRAFFLFNPIYSLLARRPSLMSVAGELANCNIRIHKRHIVL